MHGRYPAILHTGYILIRITAVSGNRESIGFLCWLDPDQTNRILPHEKVISERVEMKIREREEEPSFNKPVCLLHQNEQELIDHIRLGILKGEIFVSRMVGDLLYEYVAIKEKEWADQLSVIMDRIRCMVIADGHHRTAACLKRRKSGKEDPGLFAAVLSLDQVRVRSYQREFLIHPDHIEDFQTQIRKHYNLHKLNVKPEEINALIASLDDASFICKYKGDWNELIELDTTFFSRPGSADLLDRFQSNIIQPYLDKYHLKLSNIISLRSVEERVNQPTKIGMNKMVFFFPPVSSQFLWAASLRGETLPAKSTWIEPRMLSDIIQVPNTL